MSNDFTSNMNKKYNPSSKHTNPNKSKTAVKKCNTRKSEHTSEYKSESKKKLQSKRHTKCEIKHKDANVTKNCHLNEHSSDSNDTEWENIDDVSEFLDLEKHSIETEKSVQFEIKVEDPLWSYRKRERKSVQEICEEYIRKEINKCIKEVQQNIHKTHILCLLAHGMFVNKVLTSHILLSTGLSLLPNQYFSPKRFDLAHLEKFIKWFCDFFKCEQEDIEENYYETSLEDILQKRLTSKCVRTNKELVFLFVLISRSVGMNVRLIFCFHPISWKSTSDMIKPKRKDRSAAVVDKKDDPDCGTSKQLEMCGSIKEGMCLEPKHKNKYLRADEKEGRYSNALNSKVDSDSDFEIENIELQKCKKLKNKRSKGESKQVKCEKATKNVMSEWIEVFLEEEEEWIAVDVLKRKVHCVHEIGASLPNSAIYIIAYNPDQSIKDVTVRYISNWLVKKKKMRCDEVWWLNSIKPFKSAQIKDKVEDEKLEDKLKEQPLPTTIGEYKNNPLYALQRHLLKFEAIYPSNTAPIGYIRKEPVYPRECVKVAYGREYWLKEAKTVKVGEEPYKIVKARPKWDGATCKLIKDRPLELFGEWQIEEYVPPRAKNGKVPCNEYGNVELFKPSMLPFGCVHIPLNGLSRTARKLSIDCAPAMVGFEFSSGRSYPIFDGYVVCEEFKDIILDAWREEEVERVKREEARRIQKIYDNWKKLIQGIMIRERLKKDYGDIRKSNDSNTKARENHEKQKQNKQQVSQPMNSSLNVANATHPKKNLGIKRSNTSMRDYRSNTKTKKSKIQLSLSLEKINLQVSSESEDEGMKEEKIRCILKWEPRVKKGPDPALSDDSE